VKPAAALAAALTGAAWLAGCASYEARPVDLPAHRAAWLARAADSPELLASIDQLRAADANLAFDPSDGISAQEADVIALVYNADLRLARLRAGVTRAGADHAGRWEDPVLGGNIARFVQSAPHPWMLMSTVGLTLPLSGRLRVERELAGAEHAVSLARVYQQEWATLSSLRRAWIDWSASQAKLGVMRDYLARLDSLVGIVDELERAGEMAAIEARMFRIERAMRRNELVRMESMTREAELMLRQLMGISPSAPLTLVPGAPAYRPIHNPAEGLAVHSPMLATAVAEYQTAEHTLRLEVRRQYPDLMVGPGYGREEGMDQAVAMFNLPIPLWNRNQQAIARATAQRELARAMVETSLEQLESELAQAHIAFTAAAQQRETLEREIVPLVDRQYADARTTAELGEVNTLLLLESLSKQQEARTALIEALRQEQSAAARLRELAGPRTGVAL
jgi:cobalt-zinc-cadmium efflux system outer membrane protein